MPTKYESVEEDVRDLLERTRSEAERYASAQYRRTNQEGKSGLGMRLEAIEEALMRIGRAVDELAVQTRRP